MAITRASADPYRDRLRALLEMERVYEMLSSATYAMEREIPAETLALADRIWFGDERRFQTARQSWTRLQDELERCETQRLRQLALQVNREQAWKTVETDRGAEQGGEIERRWRSRDVKRGSENFWHSRLDSAKALPKIAEPRAEA
jgi:hypothetical protein